MSSTTQPGPEPVVIDVSADEAIRLRRHRLKEQIDAADESRP